MVNLPAVFIANGAAILLLLTILGSSKRTLRYSLLDDRIYYLMIVSTILQCVLESAAFYVDGKIGYRGLSWFFNSFLYANNILFAFMWTVYADFKLFADVKRIRKIYPLVAIPELMVEMGVLLNLFVPVFFTISEENVYQRTGGYLVTYLVTCGYLAYGVILIYAYRNKVNKYLFLPAVLFMIPILIGSLVQFFFYGLALVWLGVAIALVSLYVNVQNEISYTDSLSGLFTRQYMKHYLESVKKRMNNSKKLAGIMLDIDQFKQINDTFGHLTGDDAIHSVGKILHDSVPPDALAIRYAGDEFMIIQWVKEEEEIHRLIQKIEENTRQFNEREGKPYYLVFSEGYSLFNSQEDSLDDFFGRMDRKMYEDKKRKAIAKKESYK